MSWIVEYVLVKHSNPLLALWEETSIINNRSCWDLCDIILIA